MLKIAVTGSNGLIGSRIIELLKDKFDFIPLPSKTLDITNKENVSEVLPVLEYDILLHLAAYTNVDGAEQEKELAYKINVEGTKNIIEEASRKDKKIIYVSTDFVFDGNNPPYFEDSLPNPISYYAETKYEGEKIVKDNAMIVRISYPYRASYQAKPDFMRIIKNLLEQKKNLSMVTDSLMTPTFIDDIAYSFEHLFNNFSPEIFHLAGEQSMSPYDAGKLIAKTFGLDESLVQPVTYEQYFENKAKRPRLLETKSKKNNFFGMKTFEEGLRYCNSL